MKITVLLFIISILQVTDGVGEYTVQRSRTFVFNNDEEKATVPIKTVPTFVAIPKTIVPKNVDSKTKELPKTVAVCFIGQFMRHQMIEGNIKDKFGLENMRFSAFIATSTQHEELNSKDIVNQDTLCKDVLTHGFERCKSSLEAYNASKYREKSKGLAFQNTNGIYPMRTASFFSTMARCMEMIDIDQERKMQLNMKPYDIIMMTRFDVINGVEPLLPHTTSSTSGIVSTDVSSDVSKEEELSDWWRKALLYDVIGSKKVSGMFDDRFFFGAGDMMYKFKYIYDQFNKLYSEVNNSPERMLYKFISTTNINQESSSNDLDIGNKQKKSNKKLRKVTKTKRLIHLGPIYDFISFNTFEVNNNKYSMSFKQQIEKQAGMNETSKKVKTKEQRIKACEHIHSKLAHKQCILND